MIEFLIVLCVVEFFGIFALIRSGFIVDGIRRDDLSRFRSDIQLSERTLIEAPRDYREKIKSLEVERDELESMLIDSQNISAGFAKENMKLKNDCDCGHGCACKTADPIIEEHVEPFVDRDAYEGLRID